ncbi:hypothetical protein [Leuconostoc pseudomesenteroides]|uniref:hypothetical protein n=1 Tax=Leuconostoc pseudomesenteroides TaxID=33968 RepID=UPI00301BF25E
MKKSTFLELFRPFCWMFYTTVILLALALALGWTCEQLESGVPIFAQYAETVTGVAGCVERTRFCSGMLFVMIVMVEFLSRFKDDDWCTTFCSIRLHQFLRRQDSPVVTAISGVSATADNSRVNRSFNRAVRKSIVDVRLDKTTVLINLPHSQQAQEVFNSIAPSLKEHLSSNLEDYFFSGATRYKNTLVFEGKKR